MLIKWEQKKKEEKTEYTAKYKSILVYSCGIFQGKPTCPSLWQFISVPPLPFLDAQWLDVEGDWRSDLQAPNQLVARLWSHMYMNTWGFYV